MRMNMFDAIADTPVRQHGGFEDIGEMRQQAPVGTPSDPDGLREDRGERRRASGSRADEGSRESAGARFKNQTGLSGFRLILRVDEHFKEGQAELSEVENEVREKLYYPLFQPKIREYLTQLRQDAFLEIREGFVDVGAAPGKDTRWLDPAMLR